MKYLVAFTMILVAAVSAQAQSRRFDLKGDVLGESVAAFKARHPLASCEVSDTETECTDSKAPFAGHNPYEADFYPGLSADFYHGRLTAICYEESYSEIDGGDIPKLLIAKFGKPSYVGSESWEWFTPKETLAVILMHADEHAPRISIYLGLAKSPEAGDI